MHVCVTKPWWIIIIKIIIPIVHSITLQTKWKLSPLFKIICIGWIVIELKLLLW